MWVRHEVNIYFPRKVVIVDALNNVIKPHARVLITHFEMDGSWQVSGELMAHRYMHSARVVGVPGFELKTPGQASGNNAPPIPGEVGSPCPSISVDWSACGERAPFVQQAAILLSKGLRS
jgi:hypothetical protein